MTDTQRLVRNGWKRVVINDHDYFIDPETKKKYRASHAIIVLEQAEEQEQLRALRLAEEANDMQSRFFASLEGKDLTADDWWPVTTKAHRKLKYCDRKYGCSAHEQLVWCGKHYHFKKTGPDAVKCPNKKRSK